MVRGGPKSHAPLLAITDAGCPSIMRSLHRIRLSEEPHPFRALFRVSGPVPDMYPHDPAKFLRADSVIESPPRRRRPFAIGFCGIRSPLKFSSALPACSRGCRQKFPSPSMAARAEVHPAEFQSCNVPHPARRAVQTPGRSRRKRRHSFPPRIISLLPLRLYESAGLYSRSALFMVKLSGMRVARVQEQCIL